MTFEFEKQQFLIHNYTGHVSEPCLNFGLFFSVSSDASSKSESIIRGLRSSSEPIRVPY